MNLPDGFYKRVWDNPALDELKSISGFIGSWSAPLTRFYTCIKNLLDDERISKEEAYVLLIAQVRSSLGALKRIERLIIDE